MCLITLCIIATLNTIYDHSCIRITFNPASGVIIHLGLYLICYKLLREFSTLRGVWSFGGSSDDENLSEVDCYTERSDEQTDYENFLCNLNDNSLDVRDSPSQIRRRLII